MVFDLMFNLDATEDQLDFPVIYASALNGFAGHTTDVEELKQIGNMRAVFDDIIKYIPVRDDDPDGPLMLQICSLDYSSYVGKIGIEGKEYVVQDGDIMHFLFNV